MEIKINRLTQEKWHLTSFTWLAAVCLISGFYSIFGKYFTSGQINLLGHIAVGFAFSFMFFLYIVRHFQRTTGTRKPLVLVTGLVATIACTGYLATGWVLAIKGHNEAFRSISSWHTFGAALFVAVLLVHFVLSISLKYKSGKSRTDTGKTYGIDTLKSTGRAVVIYTALITLSSIGYELFNKPLSLNPLTENYEYSYGDHPFRPSQTETSTSGFIHEKQVSGSFQCAGCHQDIARQWYSSIHRQAASDPAYVRNVTLLEAKTGIAATRYCEGCHAPVALLVGELTPGGNHAGVAGTVANHEGISCLGCHAISETVHLNGVASYYYTPPNEYLFAYSDNSFLLGISQYLTKVSAQQHRRDVAAPVLSESRQCATCHAQFMDKSMNNWGWVKMQDDYSAWLDSPYSQQHQQTFAASDVTRCQDCHMPLTKGSDPSADADGMIRSHRFLGANTMVPFITGDTVQLEKTQAFLQSNKMRITIEKPHRSDAIQSTLNIVEELRLHSETPYYQYLGETLNLDVVVSNIGVGHDFPGGSTDINEPWIELIATDSTGTKIFHSGYLEEDGKLDSKAHAYVSKPIDKHGQLVWKHDLFIMTGEIYKNVVKAGQSDLASYSFDIPTWAKSPLVITATLKYRKLNNRYARWALQDQYRPLPITDMARDTLVVEIFNEKKVTGTN